VKLPSWLQRLGAYFDNPDPRLAAACSIALIIAGNQPTYPLYVYAIAGNKALPALLTWLSAPFFAAVPAVSRRRPLAGRLLLVAVSIGNTALAALALGVGSGVELLYIPCLALAPLLFRRPEARIAWPACLGGIALGLALARTGLAGHLAAFDGQELASLQELHAFSVVSLLFVFVFLYLRIRRRERTAPGP
jgi:hypothetical protein